MKTTALAVILTALTTSLCLAQDIGSPEARGLTPVTGTMWVNTNYPNNGKVEAASVAIAANGNVFFTWEDDGPGILDYGGVWTIYNGSGTLITPPTEQTNLSLQRVASYQKITNTFLSNFRADGSAVWGQPCGWSTHAKANRFGDGLSVGKITWTIGWEVPEFFWVNFNDSGVACTNANGSGALDACIDACDDEAAWQLLNNDGTPHHAGPINGITNIGILMFSDAECQPAGSVRVGGFEYLANGNIVIVGESRKAYDRTTRFGTLNGGSGDTAVYKIVTPGGVEVLPYSLVNAGTNNRTSITKTTGVTSNGFAVRFLDRVLNRGIVRMFDNNGTTTTGDINIFALTGYPQAGADGDAGGIGFCGNGKDAYLLTARGNPGNNTNGPWLTVLNANGTLRWSRAVADVSDPIDNTAKNEVSGAIAEDGRVIAVWVSPLTNTVTGTTNLYLQARLFSPSGCPLGARFVVSEYESPTNGAANPPSVALDFGSPHVDWRGNLVAIDWTSQSPPDNPSGFNVTLGARILTTPAAVAPTPPTGLTITQSGSNVTISWSGDGVLESADGIAGSWTPITGCSPYTTAASSAMKLYRVKLSW